MLDYVVVDLNAFECFAEKFRLEALRDFVESVWFFMWMFNITYDTTLETSPSVAKLPIYKSF